MQQLKARSHHHWHTRMPPYSLVTMHERHWNIWTAFLCHHTPVTNF